MANLIPGYEYDIFISYRQKDNKGDKWVSEFVEALKTELESTFKDEVSVYFDINPHDGLLETHDVDASLKEKLKCAVFIPIISRTYCDPKSFAWVHEFKAFIEQASKDQYGLKVRLPGGNIANRVLPVQIHDLDPEDKKLVESELGGFIRGIDFIYKEPGVNRPLTPWDDEKKNLSGTVYRNQVNKVANAIREIITGLKQPFHQGKEVSEKPVEEIPSSPKKLRTKILALIVILAVLIVPGYLIIPGLIKPEVKPEKSIAVLPFDNYSNDPSQDGECLSLTDEIIKNLYKIKSIDRVATMPLVMQFKGSKEDPSFITSKLKVNYLVQGNYKKYGEKIRINVYMVDRKADKYLLSAEYDTIYSAKEIISIQSGIATKIAWALNAKLTSEESNNLNRIGTLNTDAFTEYQAARSILFTITTGIVNYASLIDSGLLHASKAWEIDPNYADAFALSGLFWMMKAGYFGLGGSEFKDIEPEARRYAKRAISLDNRCSLGYIVLGIIDFYYNWDYINAENNFKKCFELSPTEFLSSYCLAEFDLKTGKYDDALTLVDFCKSKGLSFDETVPVLSLIRKKETLKALSVVDSFQFSQDAKNSLVGERYFWLTEYDSASSYIKRGSLSGEVLPALPKYQSYLAFIYFKNGDKKQAVKIVDELKVKYKFTRVGSPDFYLSGYYSMIHQKDSAFVWLEKAFATQSPEISWLKADPMFDNLRDDPRYPEFYARAGFKAYDDYLKTKNKN